MPFRRALLLVYALLVAYASLRQGSGAIVEPWDKAGHLGTYAVFAAIAFAGYGPGRRFILLAAAIVLYSALLEVAQGAIPSREMSLLDLLANVAGVVAGSALSLWRGRKRRAKV